MPTCFLAGFAALALAAAAPGADRQTPSAALPHPRSVAVTTAPLADVRLLDGPFRAAQERDVTYLLALDPDRLLHTFRLNAGLPSSAAPLGGWEAPDVELRGHSLGHFLSACALMHEATSNEALKQRALATVAELRKVQDALQRRGANAGYLSAFPEEFFDRLEARQAVWAPYYTLHKIMAGLLDVYTLLGDPTALDIVKGMAGWVALRASHLDDAKWQELLNTEYGGMQDVLTELYAVTKDPEHLRLARLFDQRSLFDPLARSEDPLDGLHANTQIPKAIGAALDCETTGERRYCEVSEHFWERVARHRSYVIGGNSEDEHFFPTAHFSRHLGESTAETCNTYNMLKLTRRLFQRRPDASFMDFYERGLLNHVLASQDPGTGMVSYYVSMKPGAFRTYSTPDASFWCCVGTGMENPARYGEAIYARGGDALYVNLFLASEMRWREQGLVLRQDTAFPDEGHARLMLRLERPVRLTLHIRRPSWAGDGFAVSVNGARQNPVAAPGSFEPVTREWRDGDVIDVTLPMRLRLESMPDDPTTVAFLYGPIVLGADLGGGLTSGQRLGPYTPEFHEPVAVPALVAPTRDAVLAAIKPAGAPLTFRTLGIGRPADIELRPFFRLSDHRYAVYLKVMTESGWAGRAAAARAHATRRAAIDARTIDRVQAGVADDERLHAYEGTRADEGWLEGRRYRSGRAQSSFSYLLQVPATGSAAVRVTYWGGETRRHRFNVSAAGEVLATQSLFDNAPGEFFEVEYPLPARLLEPRQPVRVEFRPAPGSSTGAVFEVRVVRPEPGTASGREP
jgi:hypothetical protein